MAACACSACPVETVNSNDVEIKDGHGNVLRCISLQTKRPDFLADAIPCATRSLQGSDPTQWAMTNVQLLEFFNYVRSTPEYEAAKQARGHVCLYDVNSLFVIPWSRGFGCGVALLMNAHAPLKAQVMISHAWGEDVEELASSLSSWASRIQSLWDCDGVPLWCCTFAQYQPEDGAGPSLQHQLSLDPFKSVIHSEPKHGMLVVHTTKADPYDRLWCVHEVDEALDSKLFVTAIGTYSLGGRTVCTCRAKCGNPADEERIRAVIESKAGGYERLDRTIKAFRNTLLKSAASVVAEIQIPWHNYTISAHLSKKDGLVLVRTNRLLLNLEGLELDKICRELSVLGLERKELLGLLTLTDSDGCEIPFEPVIAEREHEGQDFHFSDFPVTKDKFPTISYIILGQPLAQQQFPLKMACALEVRRQRRVPQNEVASSSNTIEKVFDWNAVYHLSDRDKIHPVLRGHWMSGSLSLLSDTQLRQAQVRVSKEIRDILRNPTEHADLFRFDFRRRNLTHWGVYLRGARGTPYDSGWFAAEVDLPNGYPYQPPQVKIFTKILHPNIGAESGEVCLDSLSSECWSPALTMHKVLLSVVALLAEPEPQDPVNVEAAALQLNHPELFVEKARLWTRTYALPEPPSFQDLGIGTLSSP